MILSSSSSRDKWLGASTASSEIHLSDAGPQRPNIFCETAGTSALLFLYCCIAFHRRFVFQTLFAQSVPLLRMASEHVEHVQTVVVSVSKMAHLPFLACIWHCPPHRGHGLSLSGCPGFFASQILHSGVSFHRRFFLHYSGFSFCLRCSPRI